MAYLYAACSGPKLSEVMFVPPSRVRWQIGTSPGRQTTFILDTAMRVLQIDSMTSVSLF
jgi:hypothetical protein